MSDLSKFDSRQFEHYVEDVQCQVAEINRLNQEIYQEYQRFAGESYTAYAAHLQSLMAVKSPLEYFQLQGRYAQEQFASVQSLMQQRYARFAQLTKMLQGKYNIMFLFPPQLQEAFGQFSQSGKLDWLNSELWTQFSQKLLNR
jgi:hypothetical protein